MTDYSAVTAEEVANFLGDSMPGRMGIEPLELADGGRAKGRMVVDGRHLHPGGYVHGGAWTTLGDAVAAWATFRAIPPHHDFTTIELKLNVFTSGLPGDELIADAEALHRGRSTIVVETRMVRVRDGKSKLAANLIATQFVIPPPEPD